MSSIEAKDGGLIPTIGRRYGRTVQKTRHRIAVKLLELIERYRALKKNRAWLNPTDDLLYEWAGLSECDRRAQIELILITRTPKNEV